MKKKTKQNGSVSLFVVIFAALLITVIVVSFVRIMIQNQQQATAVDLSQSALDSAQAGVEDAKRALLHYQSICDSGGDCVAAKLAIDAPGIACNASVRTIGLGVAGGEVLVQTNGDNGALNQAYTCVKITTQSADVQGSLSQDGSKLIPLVGVSNFDTVKIQWFSTKDLNPSATGHQFADVPAFAGGVPLLSQSSWSSVTLPNRPSIMRAQLIQYSSSGFSLNDFEGSGSNGSNNTLFLYPKNMSSDPTLSFSLDARKSYASAPIPISCNDLKNTQSFSCSAILKLPAPVVGGDHMTFLNIRTLYKSTNYRVTLIDSSKVCATGSEAGCVKFDTVQPMIDSTGRANDLFRRVQARVELTGSVPDLMDAAINTSGSLCKNFIVTDLPADYQNYNTISGTTINGCTP